MSNIPTIKVEFLGGEASVNAIDINSVAIVVDTAKGDEPIVVNRIPVEFRLYFKRTQSGSWISQNFFCYRLDNTEIFHPQHPATEGQKSKIYRAAVEVCEALDETFLREGELNRMDRELEQIEDRIKQYKDEYAAALTIRDKFAGILV